MMIMMMMLMMMMMIMIMMLMMVMVRCGEETRVVPRLLQMRSHWKKSQKESMRLEEAGLTDDVLASAISSFILEVVARHGEPAPRLCNKVSPGQDGDVEEAHICVTRIPSLSSRGSTSGSCFPTASFYSWSETGERQFTPSSAEKSPLQVGARRYIKERVKQISQLLCKAVEHTMSSDQSG